MSILFKIELWRMICEFLPRERNSFSSPDVHAFYGTYLIWEIFPKKHKTGGFYIK